MRIDLSLMSQYFMILMIIDNNDFKDVEISNNAPTGGLLVEINQDYRFELSI